MLGCDCGVFCMQLCNTVCLFVSAWIVVVVWFVLCRCAYVEGSPDGSFCKCHSVRV